MSLLFKFRYVISSFCYIYSIWHSLTILNINNEIIIGLELNRTNPESSAKLESEIEIKQREARTCLWRSKKQGVTGTAANGEKIDIAPGTYVIKRITNEREYGILRKKEEQKVKKMELKYVKENTFPNNRLIGDIVCYNYRPRDCIIYESDEDDRNNWRWIGKIENIIDKSKYSIAPIHHPKGLKKYHREADKYQKIEIIPLKVQNFNQDNTVLYFADSSLEQNDISKEIWLGKFIETRGDRTIEPITPLVVLHRGITEEDIIPYRGQWTANYTDFKYINVLNEQVNFEPKVDSSIDRLKKDTKINSYDFQTYCKQKIRVSSFTSNQKKTHTEKVISQFFRSYKRRQQLTIEKENMSEDARHHDKIKIVEEKYYQFQVLKAATDANTSLHRKKTKIRKLLRSHFLVKKARESFAIEMCRYRLIILFLIFAIACLSIYSFLGMNIPSINNMKEHIEEQIKDSGISDVGKNISYYDWLTTNFANKTMFRLSEEYIPYGCIRLEQFRAARKSLDETYVPANIKDTKKYADLAPERRLAWKNIEHFDYFKYETAGTCWKNGNKEAEKEKTKIEPPKSDCNERHKTPEPLEWNENLQGFVVDLNIPGWSKKCKPRTDISFPRQMALLKNMSYFDEFTHVVNTKFVVYSLNLDTYCTVTVSIRQDAGGDTHTELLFGMFTSPSNMIYDSQQNSTTIYGVLYTIGLIVLFVYVVCDFLESADYYYFQFKTLKTFFHTFEYSRESRRYRNWKVIRQRHKKARKIATKCCSFHSLAECLERLNFITVHLFCGKSYEFISAIFRFRVLYSACHVAFISFYFLLLQSKSNLAEGEKDILTNLDNMQNCISAFKLLYVIWMFLTTLLIVQQIILFPQTGNFFLAVKATVFSDEVSYFFSSFFFFVGITTFAFLILYGDINSQFSSVWQIFLNLGTLAMAGEIQFKLDDIISHFETDAVVAKVLLFLFITVATLILCNLLISVLSDVWKSKLQQDLWDNHVDGILREVLKRRFAADERAKDFFTRKWEIFQKIYQSQNFRCGQKGKYVGYLYDENPLKWICCCCVYRPTNDGNNNDLWTWQTIREANKSTKRKKEKY